jgi:2-polyprenyl-3-methyl-5-hydroxy-6-metoxy-1,4-benzoquinol methylase
MRLAESALLAQLARADRDLIQLGVVTLREMGLRAATFEEEGYWPPGVIEAISACDSAEADRLSWEIERYYASQVDGVDDPGLRETLLSIAYARIVSLRLRHGLDMGFSYEEVAFVRAGMAVSGLRPAGDTSLILEVGCGEGHLLSALGELGYRGLYGIDMAPAAVRRARIRLGEGAVANISCATPEEYLSIRPDRKFDAILLCDVLEHVHIKYQPDFLAAIWNLLQPRGTLVIVTPNALSGPHDSTRVFAPFSSTPLGLHFCEHTLRSLRETLKTAGFRDFRASSILYSTKKWPEIPPISRWNFRVKILLEPLLAILGPTFQHHILESTYYKGIACIKAG